MTLTTTPIGDGKSAGRGILGGALSSLTARSTECNIFAGIVLAPLTCSAGRGILGCNALSSLTARSTDKVNTMKLFHATICGCKSAGRGILG